MNNNLLPLDERNDARSNADRFSTPTLNYLDDDTTESLFEEYENRELSVRQSRQMTASDTKSGVLEDLRAVREKLKENSSKVSPEMKRLSRKLMKIGVVFLLTTVVTTCTHFDSPLYQFIFELQVSGMVKYYLYWFAVSVFYISQPVLFIEIAFMLYYGIQMMFQEKAETPPTLRETLRHLK